MKKLIAYALFIPLFLLANTAWAKEERSDSQGFSKVTQVVEKKQDGREDRRDDRWEHSRRDRWEDRKEHEHPSAH